MSLPSHCFGDSVRFPLLRLQPKPSNVTHLSTLPHISPTGIIKKLFLGYLGREIFTHCQCLLQQQQQQQQQLLSSSPPSCHHFGSSFPTALISGPHCQPLPFVFLRQVPLRELARPDLNCRGSSWVLENSRVSNAPHYNGQ